jgi:dinuclear metal center YbgI/SA1388 family protein
VNVGQLLERLDARYPLEAAYDWDPVGIQLGGPTRPVGRVAVCHEVTAGVVDAVVAGDVTTLVAYHPLLFTPVLRLTDGPTAEGRALRLVEAGTALIVIHTALDTARPGTGDVALEALGLAVSGGFGAEPDRSEVGRYSELDEPWTTEQVAARVGERLGVVPRIADAGRPIRRLGILPGSGGAFLPDAPGFVDAIVTGDVSHHRAIAARDAGVTVLDVGHSATERAGVGALYAAVRAVVPTAVHLDDDPDPWG